MLRVLLALLLVLPLGASAARKPTPRIVKVLPHLLDLQGRHTINPSLFDRDSYQAELREHPERRGGMRFDVHWKNRPGASAALTLKLELRGSAAPIQAPVVITTRAFSRGGFSQWTRVRLSDEDYARLGELVSWRVTLWRDGELLAEQRSFLW